MSKHDISTLTTALVGKSLDGVVSVVKIDDNVVTVRDVKFGEYAVDIKSFCASMSFPKHKNRRHDEKMKKAKSKLVGKTVAGKVILDLFYGPDRGYKNRSFYVVFEAACGHEVIDTVARLKNHRAQDVECSTCGRITHGYRAKTNGIRVKRTPTYIHWQRTHNDLPDFLSKFEDFRRILGDKPYARAEVILDGKTARWSPLTINADKETNLIATAIRQAFRHSEIYKAAVQAAKIETEEGTRYKCALCGELAKFSSIQVDHIDPISPLDGSVLSRDELITRIWTDKIQVLDRSCHSKKSTEENKIRKENKTRKASK